MRQTIMFFFALSTFFSITCACRANDALKERFLREAPKGWERMANSRNHFRTKVRETQWGTLDGKEVESAKSEIRMNLNMNLPMFAIETFSYKIDSPLRFAFVSGKDYAFELTRKLRTSPLVVTRLGKDDSIRELFKQGNYAWRAIGVPYELWGQSLFEMVKSPQFRIDRIEEFEQDNLGIIRVWFDCGDKNLTMQVKDARIDLLPQFDWALKSAEFKATDQIRMEIMNDYQPPQNGKIELKSYLRSKHVPIEKVSTFIRFDYDGFEYEPIPDSYFTLSNYGLPEPGELVSNPKSISPRMLLFAGAFSLFGIAYWFNRAARRGV